MNLSDVSIRRPVFTIIISAVLIVFGAISYPRLGVDLMPNIDSPYISIQVVYAGADPDVVETRVIRPLEDAVSTISGVKRITGSAVESFGMVFIEFELSVNADRAAQDVRDKVARIQRDLPSDAETPIIQKLDIAAAPVVALVLTGPADASVSRITYVAEEKLRPTLQRINGVGTVDIIGKQTREIDVIVDPEKLRVFGLTLPDVQQAVSVGNMDVPGGRITTAGTELLVKTHGEAESLDQLAQLVIASPMGAPIKLSDVATIVDGAEEARTLAAFDGQRAITLLVRKQSDANSVAVADAILKAVKEGTLGLPAGYAVSEVQNASTYTKTAIHDVGFDLIFGGVLAIIVILLFLRDGRATFISALALPVSVVATFAFMRALNFTTNMITMLALSLSIGMLIDDAIVVIENIYRHIEMGKSPAQAAKDGVSEIGLAVLATTLSIVVVFVPVAFMEGIVGRFFYQFGLTVAFAVAVSLFVSFTLTPMASAKLLSHHQPGKLAKAMGVWLDALDKIYRRTITWVLHHRAVTAGVAVLALVAAVGLARFIPVEFQPETDQGELDVDYKLPEGTSIGVAFERGTALAALAKESVPELRHTLVTVGGGTRQKVNEGKVFLKLSGALERARGQAAVAADLRRIIAAKFPGEEISVSKAAQAGSAGGGEFNRPLNFQLRGNDSGELRRLAQQFVAELSKRPGFVDLGISDRGSRPQFGFALDREKIGAAGLMPAQVAMAIRTAVNGTETSQYRDGGDRFDVVVKAPDRYREDKNAVLAMPLRGMNGSMVEVGELVRPESEDAAAQIDREDRVRQVTITGNLEGIAMGQAQQLVTELAKGIVPSHIELKFSGQAQVMRESFGYMFSALFLAILLIYMVLAAQFESFMHPLTIMVSLPLSVVGALGGLLLAHQTFSMMSFIGIIMLMGLVTKNAILLVDRANQERAAGLPIKEALVEAGATRLRPILMTTAAMVFGMLPVALGMGEGSEIRSPMGTAVIGGLITSTLLTLLVVPIVYSAFESLKARVVEALFGHKDNARHKAELLDVIAQQQAESEASAPGRAPFKKDESVDVA